MKKIIAVLVLLLGAPWVAHAEYVWQTLATFGELPPRSGIELYYPSGVAVDQVNGDVYVADSLNQLIKRFDADGNFITEWELSGAIGLTVDGANGWVYVGSIHDHRMYKFDRQGNLLLSWGGKGDVPGRFNKPLDAAVHPVTHNLFVLDSVNRRVQEFTPDGVLINAWAPDPALYNPYGIVIDPSGSYVWIANTGSLDNNIRKYNLNGNLLLSFGAVGSGPGDFRWPRGIAVDASGNIFIADTDMERVQKFTADGVFLQEFKGPETDADGPAHPRAIDVNMSTGDVYTAAAYANRIDRFDAKGNFLYYWGHHERNGLFLSNPLALAVDPASDVIYVADTMNHLIKKFSYSGEFLGQYGNWPLVHRDETALSFPGAVAVDEVGDYWALNGGITYADDPGWGSDKYVRRFGNDGVYKSGFAHPDFTAEMTGLALNPASQTVYVSNYRKDKVMRFDYAGTFLGEWGTEGNADGQFQGPGGIAVDPVNGAVFVVDTGNNRVQKFDLEGNHLLSFGSPGTGDGQFVFAANSDIAIGPDGSVFVADTGNNRIQVFDSNGNFIQSIGSKGAGPGFFRGPIGVAVDGNLLVVLETSQRELEVIRFAAAPPQLPPPPPPPALQIDASDLIWMDDEVPLDAVQVGAWDFSALDVEPFSGAAVLKSQSSGLVQNYFYNATPLTVNADGSLFVYVYIDPNDPPSEIMLQWRSGTSWAHRAYWGRNIIDFGVDGTDSRRYLGALPMSGGWVRLQVPASAVGLAGKSVNGLSLAQYGGTVWWDAAGISTAAPRPEPTDIAWVDDGFPSGAEVHGAVEWASSSPAPLSGFAALRVQSVSGQMEQVYFDRTDAPLQLGADDVLFAYVWLDPSDPPSEIMLQWQAEGSWGHRAYWGLDLLDWGVPGTGSRLYKGELPPQGRWVRLEVAASEVGLSGKRITGMAFTVHGGTALWDYAGKKSALPFVMASPLPRVTDTPWLDDDLPAGAKPVGLWDWSVYDPDAVSGLFSHGESSTGGVTQHYFQDATDTLSISPGDVLIAYVYIDPANPPDEIMLQWREGSSWQHRAYWGANLIDWGQNGTASRLPMGSMVVAGRWVRLEVPAADVGLEGKEVNGMAFTIVGGRAYWDFAGKY